MTNQQFCYWLQGYFEISASLSLTQAKVILIDKTLARINEPLGTFTQWLDQLCDYLASIHYRQNMLDYFCPIIAEQLNVIFYHAIDGTYDTPLSLDELRRIHNGAAV